MSNKPRFRPVQTRRTIPIDKINFIDDKLVMSDFNFDEDQMLDIIQKGRFNKQYHDITFDGSIFHDINPNDIQRELLGDTDDLVMNDELVDDNDFTHDNVELIKDSVINAEKSAHMYDPELVARERGEGIFPKMTGLNPYVPRDFTRDVNINQHE